jgi:hypothetical protein
MVDLEIKIADLKMKIIINDRHKKLKIVDKNLQQEKLYNPGY